VKLAKELVSGNNFHKEISNQFKSLSREVNKPNNTKGISKGLNNLSKSFNKMPKMSDENDDIVTALTEIASDLLKGDE
jgi:hypothetical protein